MFLLFLLMLIQPVEASEYPKYADNEEVCMVAAQQFEKKYQIKKHLLSTIANVESGRWNQKQQRNVAWPWTVNAQGKGHFLETKQQAIAMVKKLQAQGVRSIDVGCMQINLAYHPDAFDNLEEAFNPYKNVEYGAKFLKKLYAQKGNDWNKAATSYHSSSPKKAKKYAHKLSKVYKSIVQASLSDKADRKPIFKTKKSDINRSVATSNLRLDAVAAKTANQWRETKLAEYRQRKARSL